MTRVLFLPGIIAPAAERYAALLGHMPDVDACVRDLAVYADAEPAGYSIEHEITAISRAADEAGWDRFHLYAHSGGGACALAFAATHPERLLSLALDEPATDHTSADHADPYWNEIRAARDLPDPQAGLAFMRLQLAPGVELPARPPGPPPAWFAKRPAGIRAITHALDAYRVDPDRYRAFTKPVLFTHGSLSHPRWLAMRDRLASWFPQFRAVEFVDVHHLHTSHQAQPARTAELLRALWV